MPVVRPILDLRHKHPRWGPKEPTMCGLLTTRPGFAMATARLRTIDDRGRIQSPPFGLSWVRRGRIPRSATRIEQIFPEYRLPETIRTNNGAHVSYSHPIAGLSALSLWWIQLAIEPERTRPDKPQDNQVSRKNASYTESRYHAATEKQYESSAAGVCQLDSLEEARNQN